VWPVERRSRIGLAPGRDIAVTDERRRGQGRQTPSKHANHSGQAPVLGLRIGCVVSPLQFDPYRIVVAPLPAPEAGFTRVPGSAVQWHVLNDLAVPANQQVAGHFDPREVTKVEVTGRIQCVGKQFVNVRAAKLAGRQGYPMDDDQGRLNSRGPVIAVG